MNMKIFFALFSVLMICACAPVGVIQQPIFQGLNVENSSKVCIARAPVYIGDGNRFDLTVDGWLFAKIYPAQYLCLQLPEGQHMIGVEGQSGIGINVIKTESYFFKTNLSWVNFGVNFERLTEQQFEDLVQTKDENNNMIYKNISTLKITSK
ncbi:MAG: hypothetical protein ISS62_02865 [Desulfobacteraceae bacterium]|nr:hypothetical protein [Desulfobacteraceae bacterium]